MMIGDMLNRFQTLEVRFNAIQDEKKKVGKDREVGGHQPMSLEEAGLITERTQLAFAIARYYVNNSR